jgi:hypothetical protein
MKKKPITNRSGVRKTGRPSQSVAIQQKIWIPFGNRDQHAGRGEEARAELRQARGEHVVHPQAEREKARRDHRQNDGDVAEGLPPREGDHDGRDPARGRDEDDVDLRVAEEPEQVLVERTSPPSAGLKKWVPTSGP